MNKQPTNVIEQLSDLFAYKAEWLGDHIFELFQEPAYFPQLMTSRPCVIEGGRGSGKTTVLRGLSYEGQFALHKKDPALIKDLRFFGCYCRIDTSVMTAFKGEEVSEDRWKKLFSHYFNLVLSDLLVGMLLWYRDQVPTFMGLSSSACEKVSLALHLPTCETIGDLSDQLQASLLGFESQVNNIADGPAPPLSLLGSPIKEICSSLASIPEFQNRPIFFLLDEYENFEPYQQQVVNTLIKHTGSNYTFKICIRELGWKRKTTLNEHEQLIDPADYIGINIGESLKGRVFSQFATKVVQDRLARLGVSMDPMQLFPGLSEEEEALKLEVARSADAVRSELLNRIPAASASITSESYFNLAFLDYWSRSKSWSLDKCWTDYQSNKHQWDTRIGNYKYAMLFTLRRGKPGIRKYYSGWSTMTHLAEENIRYLLQLVEQSLLLHLRDDKKLNSPVSAEIQTKAAQNVGKKNLSELEGLSVFGAQLTKLVLGLGRVFGVLAANPEGHAPEVNQFHLRPAEPQAQEDDVEELLRAAVMHLALVRSPGTKLLDEADTKAYDYMIHPIFSPFLVFSYRRKRKLSLTGHQLFGLIKEPKSTIRSILGQNNRELEDDLADQLQLFGGYFDAGE